MSKWLQAVPPLVVGLGLGLALGLSWPQPVSSPVASGQTVKEERVPGAVLRIKQQTYRETGLQDSGAVNGDPIGHLVSFSGSMEATLLVTHEIREQARDQLPLLSGETLHRSGFSFAGLTDELLFVRKGKTLQVQREIKVETETPGGAPDILPLEVIATFEIGEGTEVKFE